MNKNDYAIKGTLTESQRQFRRSYYKKYNSTRRLLTFVGGIVCGIITYQILPKLNIDIRQPLTKDDVFKIMASYMSMMFLFRLVRQKIQATLTPAEYCDRNVLDAAAELTPQQAEQILKEDGERFDAYTKDKTNSNAAAFILITGVLMALYYVLKVKGV